MTKRVESKYKISRRLGVNLWGRAKDPINKRSYAPGQHGATRRKKVSDFGNQLREKQKLRGYYANITERQFRGIYAEAARRRGDTSENLIGLLESRLDTVIYRMGVVPTMYAARQFVSHGHIQVNGKKVNVPSYRVSVGDMVDVREKSRQLPMVMISLESGERSVPEYLDMEAKSTKAKFVRVPKLTDVPYPVAMEPNLVVEFYSR